MVDNNNPVPAGTVFFPQYLQQAGYDTAFVGKWHMGNSGGPRPGYDHWVSFPGHGSILDPVLNINGDERQHKGYITDLLNGHAVDFLKKNSH